MENITEDKTINELTLLQSLDGNDSLPIWDSLSLETKRVTIQILKNQIAEGVVAGISFIGTRAEYEVAKLIPSGTDGYIPPNSQVIITDEDDYISTEER